MRELVASLFCSLLVPGLVVGQSSTSDTAQVAAALAADFQQMHYAVYVVGVGIGAEVAAVLEQETAPEGLRPDCPSGSGASQSGVAVEVRLTRISNTEAGAEVVMRCQSDHFLGGYYGVIEYGFEPVGGRWTIVAKKIVMES